MRARREGTVILSLVVTRDGKVDRIEREIELAGPLDEPARAKLLEIAEKCPVHRTLHSEVLVETSLKP